VKDDPSSDPNSLEGRQNNQALHTDNASLWNNSLNRRALFKTTGMASVATVVALNAGKPEVLVQITQQGEKVEYSLPAGTTPSTLTALVTTTTGMTLVYDGNKRLGLAS
jgi:hypothetical protein